MLLCGGSLPGGTRVTSIIAGKPLALVAGDETAPMHALAGCLEALVEMEGGMWTFVDDGQGSGSVITCFWKSEPTATRPLQPWNRPFVCKLSGLQQHNIRTVAVTRRHSTIATSPRAIATSFLPAPREGAPICTARHLSLTAKVGPPYRLQTLA